jgi:hypothetical protein
MRLKVEKIRLRQDASGSWVEFNRSILRLKSLTHLPETGRLMNTKKIHGKSNARPTELAGYFGLFVEITHRMTNYALIRWPDREFVVETGDLLMAQRRAA